VTSIVPDRFGRYVPLVQPKKWNEGSISRSRDRTERIDSGKSAAPGVAKDSRMDEFSG
jgi:hypothetical protein